VLYFQSDKIFGAILGSQWTEYMQYAWIVAFLPSLKFLENYLYMILVSDSKSGYMPLFFVVAHSVSLAACVVLFNYGIDIYETIFYFFMISFFGYTVLLSYYLFRVSNFRENSEKCFTALCGGSGYFLYLNYFQNGGSQTLLVAFFDILVCLVMVTMSIYLSNLLVSRNSWWPK